MNSNIRTFMLDSMIYDNLLIDSAIADKLCNVIGCNKILLYITHIQEDQHRAMPDAKRTKREELEALRARIPHVRLPTEGVKFGISRFGGARFGDAGGNLQKIEKSNDARDALIAATAAANVDVFVTEDGNLKKTYERIYSTQVWNYEQFRQYIESL